MKQHSLSLAIAFGALLATSALAQTPSPATPPAAPGPAPAAAPATPPAAPAATTDATLDKLFGSHEEFKTFLADLQKAAAAEDKKAVTALVAYPFKTKVGGKDVEYKDAKALTAAYDDVFTPSILLAIKNQTYETLFATDMGVMIGSGHVWFSQIMSDAPEPKPEGVKIIAINQM
ncbi:hypothetical protein sos41_24800 [Alphaproteobacteria bacterium SO-S41]|nr:hypothetical protein sos41_24800 [Alphaproteobacteria bacterium SO-S41]